MEDQRKYYQPLTPVNDNLLCKICNKIAINALECVQCESLYCESCV
jgi:late competence protein required for DNA uptake (superfamily II DNA/RNA helicase)